MDLDVKVKATVMGAAFLIVSIDLIAYQPRTQGLISAPCHAHHARGREDPGYEVDNIVVGVFVNIFTGTTPLILCTIFYNYFLQIKEHFFSI